MLNLPQEKKLRMSNSIHFTLVAERNAKAEKYGDYCAQKITKAEHHEKTTTKEPPHYLDIESHSEKASLKWRYKLGCKLSYSESLGE